MDSPIEKNLWSVISLAWGTILTLAGWARHKITAHEERIASLERAQVKHSSAQYHLTENLNELKTTVRANHSELMRLIERISDKLDSKR